MSFLPSNSRTCEKVELRPKQCIDAALKPLIENIDVRINGSLNSKDLFYTAMCMAVDKSSVHSASKHYQEIPCETSLRYHLRKLSLEELMQTNENTLLHSSVGTLKPEKKYEFAIDFTNDPYYGKVDSFNQNYMIRSQAKKSTATLRTAGGNLVGLLIKTESEGNIEWSKDFGTGQVRTYDYFY